MEMLQNAQTARLVLAYLYNQQFESLAEEFCRKSPYLRQERCLLEIGDVPVHPFCRPLVQIFTEYNRMCMQLLTLIGQYEDKISFPDSLSELDKMDMILNLNKDRGAPCLQDVTNIGTQANMEPLVVTYTSQVVRPADNSTTSSHTSETFPAKTNDGLHFAAASTVHAVTNNDNIPTPTIHLCRDELMQLLMCERDKENDNALTYLLQQEPEGDSIIEVLQNRTTKEKGALSDNDIPLPTNQRPLHQSSQTPSTSPAVGLTVEPSNQSVQKPEQPVSANQQCQTSGELVQTGLKEIVAARILGSMAKAGFRSGVQSDTPTSNPIVKDTSGGTRSTSSRKRSHIRILDFGTPASKRSSSVPGSTDNTQPHGVASGPHLRQLFAGQGTPTGVHGNAPEVPNTAVVTNPATEVPRVTACPATVSKRISAVNSNAKTGQEERNDIESQTNSNINLTMLSSTASTSVKTVISEKSTQEERGATSLTHHPAHPVASGLPPVSEAPEQMNTTSETVLARIGHPLPSISAGSEKKQDRHQHSGTRLKLASCENPIEFASSSKVAHEKEISLRKHSKPMIGEMNRAITPSKMSHTALPKISRMLTRSSTKSANVENAGSATLTHKLSKLPTKDSIPMPPGTQLGSMRTGRSYESITNVWAGHAMALETPFKIDPLVDYPMTPRFLTDPVLSVSKAGTSTTTSAMAHHRDHQRSAGGSSGVGLSETADINTPAYPITPGAPDTPKSQSSPHNAVCYYRPDEGDTGQPSNETLPPAECTAQESQDYSMAPECATDDSDKMEIVSGGTVFVISSSPLMELYQQEPSRPH